MFIVRVNKNWKLYLKEKNRKIKIYSVMIIVNIKKNNYLFMANKICQA